MNWKIQKYMLIVVRNNDRKNWNTSRQTPNRDKTETDNRILKERGRGGGKGGQTISHANKKKRVKKERKKSEKRTP